MLSLIGSLLFVHEYLDEGSIDESLEYFTLRSVTNCSTLRFMVLKLSTFWQIPEPNLNFSRLLASVQSTILDKRISFCKTIICFQSSAISFPFVMNIFSSVDSAFQAEFMFKIACIDCMSHMVAVQDGCTSRRRPSGRYESVESSESNC